MMLHSTSSMGYAASGLGNLIATALNWTLDRRRILTLALAYCGCFSLSSPSLGHFETENPADNPLPVEVAVETVDVEIVDDQDDGIDGNMELQLQITLTHGVPGSPKAHPPDGTNPPDAIGIETHEIRDLDFDVMRFWSIDDLLWQHNECSPLEPLVVTTSLIELDTSRTVFVLGLLRAVAAGVAVGAVVLPAGGLVVAVLVGGIVRTGLALPVILNGNDVLGINAFAVPVPSLQTIATRGPAGRAKITVRGTELALTDTGQCTMPPGPQEPVPAGERTEMIYVPIMDAMNESSLIEAEPGNPANLFDEEVEDVRSTLRGVAIATAEMIAAAEIQDNSELMGTEQALERYLAAQELVAMGQFEAAVAEYEAAFLQAAISREQAIPGPSVTVPFEITTTTEFLSTTDGRDPEFLLFVAGAMGPAVVDIVGQPPGSDIEVLPLDQLQPVFRVKVDLNNVMPGRYVMQVVADDGTQNAVRDIELVVYSEMCDTNDDRTVDRSDIVAIFGARNTPAAIGDIRDVDDDGMITVNDARRCVLKCTNSLCVP